MPSDNFQIKYIIEAVDKASSQLNSINKRLAELNNTYDKSVNKTKKLTEKQKALNKIQIDSKKALAGVALQHKLNKNSLELSSKAKINDIRITKNQNDLETRSALNKDRLAISNNRLAASERRVARERQRAKMAGIEQAHAVSRGAMMRVSAPSAIGAGFAFRSAMQMEQLKISLRTLFGNQSAMVMNEIKQYAFDTVLSIKEANQLMLDIKKGAKNIGVGTAKEMMSMMKMVGDVGVTFSTTPEKRREMFYQFGQIFLTGKAEERHDLAVIARSGLPIYQALEETTGMKLTDIKKKHGARIPAHLIVKALELLHTSPEVAQALLERSESLAVRWGQVSESTFLASSSIGIMLNQQLGLSKVMKVYSDTFLKFHKNLEKANAEGGNLTTSMLSFGIAATTALPALMALQLGAVKLWMTVKSVSASSLALRTNFILASGILSSLYALTIDWGEVYKDITQHGLAGAVANMDALIAGATVVLALMTAAGNAGVFGMASKGLKMAKAAPSKIFDFAKKVAKGEELGKVGKTTVGAGLTAGVIGTFFGDELMNLKSDYQKLKESKVKEEKPPIITINNTANRDGTISTDVDFENIEYKDIQTLGIMSSY
jgi:hypothetical protein